MSFSRDCSSDIRNITRIVLLAASLLFEIAVPSRAAPLSTEDYSVPASDPGIKLFVRNKRLLAKTEYSATRTVLFIHGSTYPAEASFDIALDGHSWMDLIAERGFDAYLLDLRGYGRSTRPKEMDEAPASNQPIVTTEVALRDVAAVVADILRRRNIPKLSLIAWSWGTTIAAAYAVQNSDKVDRLVLYGPQWLGDGNVSSNLGAYRTVNLTQAREQWLAGVSTERQRDLIPSGWFERWADAVFASDPVGARHDPPVLRAPNGSVRDSQRYWRAGVPFYDPAQIVAPVLLIHGEWDRDTPASMSQALFPKLKNALWRRYVVIGEATHMLMMEKNRQQLFEEVQLFLEREAPKPAEALQVSSAVAEAAEQPKKPRPAGSEGPLSTTSERTANRERAKDADTGQSGGGEPERAEPTEESSHGPTEPGTISVDSTALMARGEAFLALGDIAAARLFYERAADSGSAPAMTALGKTYDPAFLDRARVVGIRSDPALAADWYRRAIARDNSESAFCIERLQALGHQ